MPMNTALSHKGPIGVFDSGYGGLTVLKEIVKPLANYDFIYLGDNARTPYGTRSFEVVYQYTLQAVNKLFDLGCPLVILACNTAAAKALRNIQQKNLPNIDASRRVLGVVRPSVEVVHQYTSTNHVGVFGTNGTVKSASYPIEIGKLHPQIVTVQEACPIWVPIVENDEIDTPGADYFIEKNVNNLLQKDPEIDTIILGCTHYPLLAHKIKQFLPEGITLLSQGEIVADSLKDYLHRHPEMEARCTMGGSYTFYTTEQAATFEERGSRFFGQPIQAQQITLS